MGDNGSVEWLLLAISLLLVAMCGLFVAAEFSLVTVDRAEVEKAAVSSRRAAGVLRALKTLSTQLSGAQVGITITTLAVGFLAEPAIANLLRRPLRGVGVPDGALLPVSLAVGLVLASFVTMIFGELVPKNVAIAIPLATANATQGFQRFFTKVMAYPIRFLNGTANAVLRLVGVEPQEELRSARSASELSALAVRSAREGTLDSDTAQLVEKSVAFGPRTAGEIMTPRLRMATVSFNDTVADVIDMSASTGFSKFPVIKSSVDDVVGAIHVKQAVAVPRSQRDAVTVREIMVEAIMVPETLRLDPLLSLLRGESFQLALVSDEYGGTAGVVTLEDVVEEIVGEIADEHDRSASRLRQRPDGSWIISGLLRPDEVFEATGIELPTHESYDTVAGLVLRQLGRVPQRDDAVTVLLPTVDESQPSRSATLRVVRMDGLRIDRIEIRYGAAEDAEAGS